ncbi:MAG: 4Fe-4S dicluster domain-containing protein [Dysgonamonadaceae bacterium]|jgi:ferredoxin|nr:4Fe-4S dicluster domain-containing protein [Dysgonamonadaceae bacterium]
MKFNALKIVRVVLALLFFFPILLFFCDFAGITPNVFRFFPKIQFIPAFLAGHFGFIIGLIIFTFLFGRIYCSVICPLGVFQDIISRFAQRGKKKNKKKRWYHYHKPYNKVRYTLLTVCVIFLIFGITTPLLFLDPYSNFGRIAVNIFRPAVMEGNNLLNWIALQFNQYHFYYVTIYTVTIASFLIASVALLTVGILSFLRGRLFCNAICPVGSLLGFFSKYAIFRVSIDESKCNHCGLCEKSCKSECINSKEQFVDLSRCVDCFNCLERCNKQKAIGYRFYKKRITEESTGMTRRSFLLTSTAVATTVPFIPAWGKGRKEIDVTKLLPITPPGSVSLTHFKEKCTACHLCITHCPQQILKPAGFNFGLEYAFKPHLVFYEMAFCNYNCTICSKICPNEAIQFLTEEEKKTTQIGVAQFDKNKCIVFTENTSCGACSEHCPVQAVKMEIYKDGLTLPHVYEELCIGCGGCESICPVRPIKAINILANEVHKKAQKPPQEEVEQIDTNELDFGF